MTKEDKHFFENLGVNFESGFGYEYNIFSIEQGILIAETLRTKEKIMEFKDSDYDMQKKMVPGLSDEHSGNTFGIALNSSISYLNKLLVDDRDTKIDAVIS
jgi:hypothetical protein